MTVQAGERNAIDGPRRDHGARRDLLSVVVFVVLALGSAWLISIPLWLGEGLRTPWFPAYAIAMMATPALAALVVVLVIDRPARKAHALGLLPLKPARRLLGYAALGIVVPIALVLVALPIGALLGVYPADFLHFSAYQEQLAAQLAAAGRDELPMPIGALIAVQLLTLPLSAIVNLIPALGEEVGWRGWLLPKLLRLGTVPAIVISGVIWGVWHAPLILLGYNYPDAPGWLGISAMVGMCIVFGAIFGWLRLRSDSVWPAALAHAAFNGAGASYLLFAMAGEHVDTTQATMLGWSGWIVPSILVVILVATKRFRSTKEVAR